MKIKNATPDDIINILSNNSFEKAVNLFNDLSKTKEKLNSSTNSQEILSNNRIKKESEI